VHRIVDVPLVVALSCAAFRNTETIVLTLITLLLGYLLGRLQNARWRRDRYAALARELQLIAERNENLGLRRKGKRPSLLNRQKWLLGLFHWLSPTLTRYTLFQPKTLVGWHRRYVQRYWWIISGKQLSNRVGRPRLDSSVEQIMLDIKAENPSYGAERIASLITEQLGVPVSESTVRNVLKRNPSPRVRPGQSWKTFHDNHRHLLASMDFKVTKSGQRWKLHTGSTKRCNNSLAWRLTPQLPTRGLTLSINSDSRPSVPTAEDLACREIKKHRDSYDGVGPICTGEVHQRTVKTPAGVPSRH